MSTLLIMADWLASNSENFALLEEEVILSEDEYPQKRCQSAFEKLELHESQEFDQERISDEDFKERFGFSMNTIQADVMCLFLPLP